MPEENSPVQVDEANHEPTRHPSRVRKKPSYLSEYVTGEENDDPVLTNIDYCYRLMCNVPLTFREAVTSPEEWVSAMDEEMQSLRDNDTFLLTNLPNGKKDGG